MGLRKLNQEFYLYDASGNRVLNRSISGAFSSQTDYYSIAGHLIGTTNTVTTYGLTNVEGSVLTSLSASAVLGEQIYGPYGNQRYTQGTMGTDKGYTGQFQDAVSGFDYYNARYYDPAMGQFLSADVKQGNAQGMDPYAYVNGNPETATDPTGQFAIDSMFHSLGGIASSILDRIRGSGATLERSGTMGSTLRQLSGSGDKLVKHISSGNATKLTSTPCNSSGYPAKCDNKPTKSVNGGDCSYPAKSCGHSSHYDSEDYLKLAAGIAEVGIGVVMLVAGFMSIFSNIEDGLIGLAATIMKSAYGSIATLINAGLKQIIDSYGKPNPWLDVFMDGVAVLLDVGQLVVNAFAMFTGFQVIKEAYEFKWMVIEGEQMWGSLNSDDPIPDANRIMANARNVQIGIGAGSLSVFGSLFVDIPQFASDWNTASKSS